MSDVEGDAAEAFSADTVIDLGGATALLTTVDDAATVVLTGVDGSSDAWTVGGFIGGSDRGAVPWAERDGVAWPLPVAWMAPELEHEDWQTGGWIARDTAVFFDASGAFAYTGSPDPAASAEQQCFGCHTTGWLLEDTGTSLTMTAATDGNGRWDEAAVGCEACHGPGREHTSGRLDIKRLTITNPGDLDAARANDVCEQCHSVRAGGLDTPYAWSETDGAFHAGQSLASSSAYVGWSDGSAFEGHAQADELARSSHQTSGWTARCVDCHDPHGSDYQAQLRLDEEDNTLCLTCHTSLTFGDDESAVEAHVRATSTRPTASPSPAGVRDATCRPRRRMSRSVTRPRRAPSPATGSCRSRPPRPSRRSTPRVPTSSTRAASSRTPARSATPGTSGSSRVGSRARPGT
jgi:predicted CXXCH cytochrome family protein